MPKIKQEDFEEDEEDEDEDLEDDEDEEEELETEDIPRKRIETRGRKPKEVKPVEVKRRYGIVPPQPLRYVDTETNEVIAEADINDSKSMQIAIIAAISDLKEQIERIEVQIGAITG